MQLIWYAQEKVVELGGQVVDRWILFGPRQCTHLVSNVVSDSQLYEHVDKLGGVIVNEVSKHLWISD